MGAYLPAPDREKEVLAAENFALRYAAGTMQGWRLANEDAFLVELDLGQYSSCFGVFDGHSGGEVAHYATKRLAPVMTANQRFHSGRLEVTLQETFLQLDEELASAEGQKALLRSMRGLDPGTPVDEVNAHSLAGSTACVAVVRNSQLVVASVGDSRAVLAVNGKAVELTVDHKPELPEEKRRIRRAGGSVEDNRVMGTLNLSRSLGDFEYKHNPDLAAEEQMVTAFPDVKSIVLSKDAHFLVLATDGLWDVLSPQECVDYVYARLNKQPLEKALRELLDSCVADDVRLSGGIGCDNITCILVQFKNR